MALEIAAWRAALRSATVDGRRLTGESGSVTARGRVGEGTATAGPWAAFSDDAEVPVLRRGRPRLAAATVRCTRPPAAGSDLDGHLVLPVAPHDRRARDGDHADAGLAYGLDSDRHPTAL